ncbi:MAG: methylmalonyl Co-A mutase-associated GTPase MeaB [Anaerolineae bacterium]|jgi:LAO/AO transport system kinase|nr:methylmalonyl Co-A mutase-associated GTPase MeaB [Anaerolineae bacterium]
MDDLVNALLNGSRRAVARLLTWVSDESPQASPILTALFPHTGKAWVIGITGAPGTGKSSLVNCLAKAYRAQNLLVGIIAVDPTSPFTGGAILGDRIRMRDLSGDSGVFIRSMATRGSLGGLARTTRDAIRVLDAAGFDIILVETVGAGQSEVDIVRTAHTTLVIEAPGLGDEVQAIKAGILEIADVLVVNKADRPGAHKTVSALRMMLDIGHPASRTQMTAHHGQLLEVKTPETPHSDEPIWIPPVLETIATDEKGVAELVSAIQKHREFIQSQGLSAPLERQRIEIELHERLREALIQQLLESTSPEYVMDVINQVQNRQLDPQSAVTKILANHKQMVS